MDASNGTVFERIATYRCDTGYNLAGPMTRTCGSGGNWTSSEPVCHRKFSIFSIKQFALIIVLFQLLIVAPSMILTMDKWTYQMEQPLGVLLSTPVTLATHCPVYSHVLVELMDIGLLRALLV